MNTTKNHNIQPIDPLIYEIYDTLTDNRSMRERRSSNLNPIRPVNMLKDWPWMLCWSR